MKTALFIYILLGVLSIVPLIGFNIRKIWVKRPPDPVRFKPVRFGVILVLFVGKKSNDAPYLVIVNCDDESAEAHARQLIEEYAQKSILKSTGVSPNGVELTIEVRLHEGKADFIHRVAELPGVQNAVLVGYNGDYMS